MVLAVEDLGPLRSDERRQRNLVASDALVAVRLGAPAVGFRALQLRGEDAEKSAGLVLVCPEPGVLKPNVSVLLAVVRSLSAALALALAAPSKPGGAPSVARSCADRAPAGA